MTPQMRPEEDPDSDAIDQLVRQAFGDEGEEVAQIVRRLRDSSYYLPHLALVAELDGVLIGHVMISRASIVDDAGVGSLIHMLSPLSVRPDEQGQGVGSMLVREVLRRSASAGIGVVVLEGSPTYYARFGFEPASRYRVTMPLPHWAPHDAAQLIVLAQAARVSAGRVVYPAAFDDQRES